LEFSLNFFSTFKLIIRTLLARKGRSFLTILGIVIGVAGVITIISLGAGAQSMILGQITKLGSNILTIQPGKSNQGMFAGSGVTITTLTKDDANALANNARVPHIKAVTASVSGSATITWENKTIDTSFTGADYRYPEVNNISFKKGQFLSQQEEQGNANVVVLGSTVADELFGGTNVDAIGQVVKVKNSFQKDAGGIPLRVVGVLNSQGSSIGGSDDNIFLPLGMGQQQLLGIHYLQSISVKVDSATYINQTITGITSLLRQRHHITRDVDVDFSVRNMADTLSSLTTITNALRVFLAAMAAVSLVVGGIGILNIMMVTVAERTREIGLRKAVGAGNAAIRNQFLLEAGTLTSLGGLIGIIAGTVVSYIISLVMHAIGYDWSFIISFTSVWLAIGVSILTGVIFGLYPALKAAKLNPIEALRYE
jgi:putative ABC transport system permease protein